MPGGISVFGEGQKRISPGCCCGLDEWREWIDFLETGRTPWIGHDPSPWLEINGGIVRIWSDGARGLTQKTVQKFCLDVPRSEFEQALTNVEQDLRAFLRCIERWAKGIGIRDWASVVRKFDESFHVTESFDFE